MKKLSILLCVCSFVLVSCLEINSTTTIDKKGSGTSVISMDMSEVLKKGAGEKNKTEDVKIDTSIYFKNYSDTASFLTTQQKEWLHDMRIDVQIDLRTVESAKFLINIVTPFKSLKDFTALGEFMKQKEYDAIFDKTFKIPMLDDEKSEADKKENDNMFSSFFGNFYTTTYSKGSITAKLDSASYADGLAKLGALGMGDISAMQSADPELAKMMGMFKFTHTIVLPSKAKNVVGETLKQTDNVVVQSGDLLERFTNPGKYEYSITY